MRRQRLIVLFFFVLTVLLVPIAGAQLSEEYADWADGPEGFLLTKKEKKEWGEITSDAQAKEFIELFWARRNPWLWTTLMTRVEIVLLKRWPV